MALFAAQMICFLATDGCVDARRPRVDIPVCYTNCNIRNNKGASVIGNYGHALWRRDVGWFQYTLLPGMVREAFAPCVAHYTCG